MVGRGRRYAQTEIVYLAKELNQLYSGVLVPMVPMVLDDVRVIMGVGFVGMGLYCNLSPRPSSRGLRYDHKATIRSTGRSTHRCRTRYF